MKTILLLFFSLPVCVFAQSAANSLTENSQTFIEIPLDTGTTNIDTLIKTKTPLKVGAKPEMLVKKGDFPFVSYNYLSINKLTKLIIATNDEEAIYFLQKFHRNRSLFVGLLTGGAIINAAGTVYLYDSIFKANPNPDPRIIYYGGLGMMASSIFVILNNRKISEKAWHGTTIYARFLTA